MKTRYRLIGNTRHHGWVVVSGLTCACGKGMAAAMLILASAPLAAAELAAGVLPGGGSVAAGQVGIHTDGTRMTIVQDSARAIINWASFDIGAQAQVYFQQPNAAAIILNRVNGPTASRLEGQLSANGQVFLINPNGVVFGSGARVDVGALVASTLNIGDSDFLAGNIRFSGNGGRIENHATIDAAPGGFLAFIAPTIVNHGTLNAPHGTVAMGAGEAVTLNFAGDRLVGLSVSVATLDTLIENHQAIRAEGGAILLTAAGAAAVHSSVVNNSGVLEAGSLVEDGGRIVLRAGSDITLAATSTIAASGTRGGEIEIQAQSGTLLADGRIDARGTQATGGSVKLLGARVGLIDAAVDASGATGGGTLRVGGDYQGSNPEIQNAARTFVGAGTRLTADATGRGDGGTVVVWADAATRFYGSASARADGSGRGGLIEVSGKDYLDFRGRVDAGSAHGAGGTVLFDPANITLSTGADANTTGFTPPGDVTEAFTDDAALNSVFNVSAGGSFAGVAAGSNVVLQATNNITVANAFNLATATGGAANVSLSLQANNNITVNAGATVTVAGSGALSLQADADNSGAGTLAVNAALVARQGGITLSGAAITSTAAGSITSSGTAGQNAGDISITSSGGINLLGAVAATGGNGAAAAAGGNGGSVGIVAAGTVVTAAITASGGNAGAGNAAGGSAGAISLTTSAGNLTTGALTARTGNATGTGAGGVAGSIAVTNTAAAGNVGLGALNTSGGTSGSGGTISAGATGVLTLNGAITSSGGANAAATTQAGKHAGAITLTGNNGIASAVAATLNANGGAGLGTNQAGGNAAAVVLSSASGALASRAITVRTGNATGTGAGGVAGSIALSGASVTTSGGALNTAGNNNGNGGAVSVTATSGSLTTAAITTSGGTALGGTSGRNAGAVTLSGAGAVTTGGVTANGSNGVGAGQAGGNGGVINLASNGTFSSGALAASGGNGVATATGGNAGTITVSNTGVAGTLTTGTLTARTGAAAGATVSGNAGSIVITNNAATQLQTGAVNSSGQTGGAGGSVTLSSNGNVRVTGSLFANGGALAAGTNAAGRNGGSLTVAAAGTVSLGGQVSTSGSNANTGNHAGGNAGSISLDAGGATPTITLGGNLSAAGGNRSGSGVAGAGGAIVVADTLNLGAANRTIFSRGGSAGLGQGGDITLAGPIYDSGTRTLTVTGGSGTVTVAGGPANATLANNLDRLVVTASNGAGKIRVGSVNTVAAQSYNSGSGGIELDGDVVTLGSAAADTVTFSDPVTLTGDASITTAGGAGDDIAVTQTVDGAHDLTLNAGALGNVTTSAVIGGSTPLGDFSATGAALTFGRSVSADRIFVRSTTGDLTLNTAGTVLTASAAGDAIQLVTASRFINNAGAGALNASHAAGRFLVWSQDPANDNRGGLAYAFKQYNATYGTTAVADADPDHDGFLYTLAPSITPTLTGTVSKTYDATPTAVLTAAHFTASGAVDGDTVNLSGSGVYDDKNAGVGKTVTASGITASVVNGAATVYGYAVTPTTVNAAVGTITPALLTITADNKTRPVYTPNPPFTATYVGLVGGETPADLSGALMFTTAATTASPAGLYAITPFGQTSTNYAITYVAGVLAITSVSIPGPAYDPQAIAAAYSEPHYRMGALPAVHYRSDADESLPDAPGNRVTVVSGGIKR